MNINDNNRDNPGSSSVLNIIKFLMEHRSLMCYYAKCYFFVTKISK
jgi:hypothetical protein